ncbi:hypothetical protein P4493_05410 [Bacillus thuringiensis]|jgi:hypothetical protein|uniref:Uncharacterized protein n=3 Tax=Bacillus thuringiensis TaxID=1428 RepID=A0A0B5NKG7_BACTU|nr:MULTISPECIES: hypothetical protein [Bacillus]MEC2534708.1 hypothetical protein [Bacillus cereus]MED1153566.1 hypothetical protein [Bacillus paranthracis]OUB09143.1 hypothetical protein BK708_31895 [Bacillus thuringiensis serovar yunnanensis]AFQ29894.1 hypothetical protein BTF1_28967 [Bacillus thuringiensis HD-789]AJG73907.1 hypothetical protein BF38_5681 [Bacillus thuringiensis]
MQVYEEEVRHKEVAGITDKITRNVVTGIQYPVVNILLTDNMPKHKMTALVSLLKAEVTKSEDSEDQLNKAVYISLKKGDEVRKPIGRILPKQVKTMMSILTGVDLELEMSQGEIMDSKYIYALSSY